MSPAEYRTALAVLGLSQAAAARFFGVHEVTARRWATGSGPSGPVAMILKLMLEMRLAPEFVERVSTSVSMGPRIPIALDEPKRTEGDVWLQINRSTSFKTAAEITRMLREEDERVIRPGHPNAAAPA